MQEKAGMKWEGTLRFAGRPNDNYSSYTVGDFNPKTYKAAQRRNMTALQITSMKNFMSQLLISDTFDVFLLEEAVIGTANTFTIDGRINQEFFSGQEQESEVPAHEFRPWNEIKGLCFDLIKGKRTPLFFRFVLHLMPEKASALLQKENCDTDPSQVKALVLNIRYDGSRAILTTGTAYHTFVMSKEADNIWDKALKKYLEKKGIAYESL